MLLLVKHGCGFLYQRLVEDWSTTQHVYGYKFGALLEWPKFLQGWYPVLFSGHITKKDVLMKRLRTMIVDSGLIPK